VGRHDLVWVSFCLSTCLHCDLHLTLLWLFTSGPLDKGLSYQIFSIGLIKRFNLLLERLQSDRCSSSSRILTLSLRLRTFGFSLFTSPCFISSWSLFLRSAVFSVCQVGYPTRPSPSLWFLIWLFLRSAVFSVCQYLPIQRSYVWSAITTAIGFFSLLTVCVCVCVNTV